MEKINIKNFILTFVFYIGVLIFTPAQEARCYKVDSPFFLGRHDIAELSGCNNNILSNLLKLEEILVTAAEIAGAKRIGHITHQTAKEVNSCIVLVTESHLSIHAFPLLGYAAVDTFTCGECDNEKAIAYIEKQLQAQCNNRKKITRGVSKQGTSCCQNNFLHKDIKMGEHLIVEFCGCEEGIINDEKKIQEILEKAVQKTGTQVINSVPYKFHPQGVSCIVLGQNGCQITIHTWPELDEKYCAIDILSCGDNKPDDALYFLIKELKAGSSHVKKVFRGFSPF